MPTTSASDPRHTMARWQTFFFIADLIKIAVACWLLAVMMCVTYENYVWWRATRTVRQTIAQHEQFGENLNRYAQIGDDWTYLSDNVGAVVKPVEDVSNWIRSNAPASIIAEFFPYADKTIRLAGVTSSGLRGLHDDVNALTRMDMLGVRVLIFERNPDRQNLINFAIICEQQASSLDSIDGRLQFAFSSLEEMITGITWLTDALEPWAKVSVPLFGDIPFAQPAINALHNLFLLTEPELVRIQEFRVELQRDLDLMNRSVTVTKNAQAVEQSFGTGYWRHYMLVVHQNPFLFLSLSLALLMMEACLSVEQRKRLSSSVMKGTGVLLIS